MTGGAQIGAGAAGQTFAVNRVPERIVEILIQNRFDFMSGNLGFNRLFGFGRDFIFLGFSGGIGFGVPKILGQFFSLGSDKFYQIVAADIRQQNIRAFGSNGSPSTDVQKQVA